VAFSLDEVTLIAYYITLSNMERTKEEQFDFDSFKFKEAKR
jgi:hypothetical protein